jgi:hypothetical protein
MMLETGMYVTGACSTNAIMNLGRHENAKDALLRVCQLDLLGFKGAIQLLPPFYIFSAGPEIPGQAHSKPWVKYGTEFAAYLVENGLGEVATCGQKLNKKYHPTTTCQVWIWSPNQEAVVKWWEANKKDAKAKEPR